MVYEGTIDTLGGLPYHIDAKNQSWIKEEDIIQTLCQEDGVFYMTYFIGKTYIGDHEKEGKFPLLSALIAIREVFEFVADQKDKSETEKNYERRVFPFISQLAKIGVRELFGHRTPLEVMEEMLLRGDC